MARGKTKEELAEISKATRFNSETGRANQPKSVKARYAGKTGKELALAILATPLQGQELADLQTELGVSEELTLEAAMDAAMARAAKGFMLKTDEGYMGVPPSANAYEKLMKKAGIYAEKHEVASDKPLIQLVVANEVAERNAE